MRFRPLFDQVRDLVSGYAACDLEGAQFAFAKNDAPPRYIWVPHRGKLSGATGSGRNARQIACRNPVFMVYCHGRDYDGAEAMAVALHTVCDLVFKRCGYDIVEEAWPAPDGIKAGLQGAVCVVTVAIKDLPVYRVTLPTPTGPGVARGRPMPGVELDEVATILSVQAREDFE